MAVLQVRYLTRDDLVKLGAHLDAAQWGKWAADSVYPVQEARRDTSIPGTPMMECVVVTNYEGERARIRMTVADYERLGVVPTHESVAEVPRKDMRGK